MNESRAFRIAAPAARTSASNHLAAALVPIAAARPDDFCLLERRQKSLSRR